MDIAKRNGVKIRDWAEFVKKRNTDYEFFPPFMWAENNRELESRNK